MGVYNYGGWNEVGVGFLMFLVSEHPKWLGEDLSPLNLRNLFQTISMTFLSSSNIFPRLVTKFLFVCLFVCFNCSYKHKSNRFLLA